jgi:ATP-binding cassette subfamily B protein
VGERDVQVIGAQNQWIAIDRAIILHPSILILDEATSVLDSQSKNMVQAALDNVMSSHNKITLVITHHLSTIKNANRIVVVEGAVVWQWETTKPSWPFPTVVSSVSKCSKT